MSPCKQTNAPTTLEIHISTWTNISTCVPLFGPVSSIQHLQATTARSLHLGLPFHPNPHTRYTHPHTGDPSVLFLSNTSENLWRDCFSYRRPGNRTVFVFTVSLPITADSSKPPGHVCVTVCVHSYDGAYHVTASESIAFSFYMSNKAEFVWHSFSLAAGALLLLGIYIFKSKIYLFF